MKVTNTLVALAKRQGYRVSPHGLYENAPLCERFTHPNVPGEIVLRHVTTGARLGHRVAGQMLRAVHAPMSADAIAAAARSPKPLHPDTVAARAAKRRHHSHRVIATMCGHETRRVTFRTADEADVFAARLRTLGLTVVVEPLAYET